MENTPKDRAKILVEELKILQGVINQMAQNSLECKKMDSRSCGFRFYPLK